MTEDLRAKFEHLKVRLANEQETSTQRGTVFKEYIVENERLKKQLAIAVGTLKNTLEVSLATKTQFDLIQSALKQIEELNK